MRQWVVDWCDTCQQSRVGVIPLENGDYICTGCGHIYDVESGIYDLLEAKWMLELYRGAKIAGLIEESDTPREPFWKERIDG